MLKKIFPILIAVALFGCGGGDNGGAGGTSTNNNASALFSPTMQLGGIQCQCASCIAGVTANSASPIAAVAFSVDTQATPATNEWIAVNGATGISTNYRFLVPSPMSCTAYYNSQICLFAKGLDGQIASGPCQIVRRIY
jgi:hypothetical protein